MRLLHLYSSAFLFPVDFLQNFEDLNEKIDNIQIELNGGQNVFLGAEPGHDHLGVHDDEHGEEEGAANSKSSVSHLVTFIMIKPHDFVELFQFLPKNIWRNPPRMRTMSPVQRTARMFEKSCLVWKVKAVSPTTTAAVMKNAWMTTLWSKNVTKTPAEYHMRLST